LNFSYKQGILISVLASCDRKYDNAETGSTVTGGSLAGKTRVLNHPVILGLL